MAKKATVDELDDFMSPDYKLPESAEFMKLLPGRNRFRVLSSLVTGYLYWDESNKPHRSPVPFEETPGIKIDAKTGKGNIQHFWAVVVWNYATESIQTLELTQKGIQKYITELLNDPEWGSPKKYDLVVTREGDGLATKYTVAANPHKDVPANILEMYEAADIDLQKMFDSE